MAWNGSGTFTRTNGTYSGSTVWADDRDAGVKITAANHDTHDKDLADGINACLAKNGENAATADIDLGNNQIINLGAGFDLNHAVSGIQITNGANMPAGTIVMTGRATANTGWLLCNGAAVSRTTYATLFTAISTAFGVGDGSTTFNLPDLQQRFPMGKAAAGTGSTLGGTGGAVDHTHSVPAHYHGMGLGADLNITAGGSHAHDIQSRPDDTTSTGDYYPSAEQTTQGVQAKTTDAATHTHTSGTFAGSIGLVTGGVNGNAAMTSGTQNPPYQVVNYQIKT